MNSCIKAVIFDWAWTLVDLVDEDDRRPFLKMFEFLHGKGVQLPDFNQCYQNYRGVFYQMIDESRETHREACFEPVLKFLFFHYGIDISGKTSVQEILNVYYREVYSVRKVFPDVHATLKGLEAAGIRMGIISNTTNPPFMKDFERMQMGLDPYFEFSIYSSDVPYRKPHPSIFKLAASYLKLDAKEILFVGDSLAHDIAGAQGAGMQALWINRKGRELTDGIVPEYKASRLTDILEMGVVQGSSNSG